jgi:hypothetical protein
MLLLIAVVITVLPDVASESRVDADCGAAEFNDDLFRQPHGECGEKSPVEKQRQVSDN